MRKNERESAGVPERVDDGDEPQGKSVTGILLGILALFMLVMVLQLLQRC
jgi:hypothetical protein